MSAAINGRALAMGVMARRKEGGWLAGDVKHACIRT